MATSPNAEGRAGVARLFAHMRQPAPIGGAPPGVFSPQMRRCARVWVCVSLPVVAIAGHFATTPQRYLVVFVVCAAGFYTTPALFHTWLAARRAPVRDKPCFWLWLAAIVIMYCMGLAILAGTATGVRVGPVAGPVGVAVVSVLLMTATVLMVRSRSGGRAVSVDMIEGAMSMIVIVAPLGLVWGEQVIHAQETWYAIPAALAVPCTVFGVYWAVQLYLRLGGASGAIGSIGVALASFGFLNAVGQTAQGVTGFALPPVPLLVLQGLCMSLLGFVPLYVPDRISPGLNRLPPQQQVRGAWLPAALVLVGLPVLLVTTLAMRDRHAWAPLYSLGVAGVLLVLAALRQLAGVRETQRLYGRLEQAAETRRQLLAQVMQRSDDDRHRVAAQLHEQAVAAYATFVSFMQAGSLVPTNGSPSMIGASAIVRDELGKQAESLRKLMLAMQPLEVGRSRTGTLSTPIRAYVDGLYGDRVAPTLVVTMDDDLVLDWATETIVLRIVQEAVSNVWRHSEATRLDVTIGAEDRAVVVRVTDDGVGFAPRDALFESGIGVMRSLASLGHGTVEIDSTPRRGTQVTVRLGPAPDVEEVAEPLSYRPHLRVVADG
jgi:signal transduction histidine kinase